MNKKFIYTLLLAIISTWIILFGTLSFANWYAEDYNVEIVETFKRKVVPPSIGVIKKKLLQSVTHQKPLYKYIEVVDACGPNFDGACVNMRSGPGEDYPVFTKLRNGVVLRVADEVTENGREWYKIQFDEDVRYPERLTKDWFVASEFVHTFLNEGNHDSEPDKIASSTKRILIDRSEQILYAYDGNNLFMQEAISTGLEFTPTPRGNFQVYKMTPSRYMQGPLPGISDQYFDLPGVPWNLYFTYQGGAIHGAYWHNNFGQPWSHGCVNLPPEKAKKLYLWAEIGTNVLVQD